MVVSQMENADIPCISLLGKAVATAPQAVLQRTGGCTQVTSVSLHLRLPLRRPPSAVLRG